ncbi:MAG TPA: hypothetical protein VME19_05685 [Streptosporangiaceae bacterium]|nr:hypothetical protein [Streptosporangiaceae bacterium]
MPHHRAPGEGVGAADGSREEKITAEDAEQLIAALERDQPPAASSLDARPKGRVRYLRVVADALEDSEPTRACRST